MEHTHPSLLPYNDLDAAALARSRDVGIKFLLVVHALGFVIAVPQGITAPTLDSDISHALLKAQGDRAPLSLELQDLVELLAADRHHTWAWNRLKLGPPARDDARVVPYTRLDDEQRAGYVASIEALLRFILGLGFRVRRGAEVGHGHARRSSASSLVHSGLTVSGVTSGSMTPRTLTPSRVVMADDASSYCGIMVDEDEDDIKQTFAIFDKGNRGVVPKSSIVFALQTLGFVLFLLSSHLRIYFFFSTLPPPLLPPRRHGLLSHFLTPRWDVDVTEAANIAIQMNPHPGSSTVTYHQFNRWIRRREAARDAPVDMDAIIDRAFVHVSVPATDLSSSETELLIFRIFICAFFLSLSRSYLMAGGRRLLGLHHGAGTAGGHGGAGRDAGHGRRGGHRARGGPRRRRAHQPPRVLAPYEEPPRPHVTP